MTNGNKNDFQDRLNRIGPTHQAHQHVQVDDPKRLKQQKKDRQKRQSQIGFAIAIVVFPIFFLMYKTNWEAKVFDLLYEWQLYPQYSVDQPGGLNWDTAALSGIFGACIWVICYFIAGFFVRKV
ncbi:hypothetical protein [Parasulfitobacter algicola]|uniref:Uncharacterized protein n=1 Tax=Parasulfitobacter algicola TaxID=2614809 RepID=A0ABX2IYC5_9RHOB|nr:hypothetical protein [Sulfitobacter algicola]NSX56290.1 hypothetical protein [Sulfitobacter algicola]